MMNKAQQAVATVWLAPGGSQDKTSSSQLQATVNQVQVNQEPDKCKEWKTLEKAGKIGCSSQLWKKVQVVLPKTFSAICNT